MRSMFFYNNSIKDPRPWLSENGKIIFTPEYRIWETWIGS